MLFNEPHNILETNPPTNNPTETPTFMPTMYPTLSPSVSPTIPPSLNPTSTPSSTPTEAPTIFPTKTPSTSPSHSPSTSPTTVPTTTPSDTPTTSPTINPSTSPTLLPTLTPTKAPIIAANVDAIESRLKKIKTLYLVLIIGSIVICLVLVLIGLVGYKICKKQLIKEIESNIHSTMPTNVEINVPSPGKHSDPEIQKNGVIIVGESESTLATGITTFDDSKGSFDILHMNTNNIDMITPGESIKKRRMTAGEDPNDV